VLQVRQGHWELSNYNRMSRWLKITIFSIVLLLVFSSNQFFVKAVGISDSIRSGLSEAQVNASLPSYDTSAVPLPVLLGRVIGYALSFAGILFFGLSLYGGFLCIFYSNYLISQSIHNFKNLF
jgi:hypothetical protein